MRPTGMVLLAGLLSVVGPMQAEQVPSSVVEAVSNVIPGAVPDSIEASPIPDVYEVVFGPHVVYVTGDGEYMLQGELVEIATRVNLTESKRKVARLGAIEKLGEDSMIVFAPEETEHTLTVFTDIDCGYCVKLHQEMETLNRYGIKVRYLAFPRAGIPSENYDRMVSVWCADEPDQAMTMAKLDRKVSPKTCDNPVKSHYELGQFVGVNGTPTLVFENGEVYPGYAPADRLIQLLRASSG